MPEQSTQSENACPNLSPGLRGFLDLIDNAQSYDDIQKIPRSWHEKDDTSIDEMWECFNSQQKKGTTNGETAIDAVTFKKDEAEIKEGAIPKRMFQRGYILKWMKKPARKGWKTIWGIFRCER